MARSSKMKSIPNDTQVSFKGNIFYLVGEYLYGQYYYKIVDITPMVADLVLPESFQDVPIWEMNIPPGRCYTVVRFFTISQSLMNLNIKNNIFPLLKKVKVKEKGHFSTDGKLLFIDNGRTLLNCLVQDFQDMVIPENVAFLAKGALESTMAKNIRFENPKLQVSLEDFRNTACISSQPYLIVGERFLYLNQEKDYLVIPDSVKSIEKDAFKDHVPICLESPFLPLFDEFFSKDYRGDTIKEVYLRRLIITSPEAVINLEDLRKWEFLESITLACDHPLYCTEDGILYDKEKKSLLFYPRNRLEEEFQVPDGVERIGYWVFSQQKNVKKITMTNSVKYIDGFAFMNCNSLETLILSDEVELIPDTNPYFVRGTISNSRKLVNIHLPAKLKYIGNDGLYNTAIEHVELPEGLEFLGNYSLYTRHLQSVSLPKSLKVVRIGAVYGVPFVTAYEGTAKGLVGGICPSADKEDNARKNDYWHKCNITVLDENGEKKGDFYLPSVVNPVVAQILYRAWDGQTIDYLAYAEATDLVKLSEDRVEMSLILLFQAPKPIAEKYEMYVRRRGTAVATQLIDHDQKERFVQVLEKGLLTLNSVEKLLEYCNQTGKGSFAAYLMDYKDKNGRKKREGSVFPL